MTQGALVDSMRRLDQVGIGLVFGDDGFVLVKGWQCQSSVQFDCQNNGFAQSVNLIVWTKEQYWYEILCWIELVNWLNVFGKVVGIQVWTIRCLSFISYK